MQRRSRPGLVCCRLMLSLAVIALGAPNLHAQYFGKNKVRYEDFDFKVLKTAHFDIYYYDEEANLAENAGRMAERWYARLSKILDHQLPLNQPVILYASHPAFRSTTVLPDEIGEGTGGVTEGLRRRIIMPAAGPLADTDHVLGHELVHAFQYDMTTGPEGPGMIGLPLWFVEGMAEYLSLGAEDSLTSMWVRDAVLRDELPTIKKLDDPRYFPYRFGQAFWAYVGGTYGDDTISRILRRASRDGVERAIEAVLNISGEVLVTNWHDALKQKYGAVLRATVAPTGQPVIEVKKHDDDLYVGPVLSPDGSRMILFSSRDLFSIDLYLADAQTGRILRKLTETAVDPHFESLEFISSAGGWSADGKRFAFGAISSGRPELVIYDVEGDRVEQRHRLRELGEILSVTWSPDGRSIALSALSHGVTDLFILDQQTGALRQLTNDGFADLHPSWSPNGSSIVFATDRFTSDLTSLSFGAYRLALVNVSSGAITPLRAFNEGKHINPEWSADGNSIYFVSDRDGISNVYRLSVANGAISQLTNVKTGVSGITQLSPAISVAGKSNRLVFTSFTTGNYSIYRIDTAAGLAGTPVSSAVASLEPAILPPPTSNGEVSSFLRNPRGGLVSSGNFTNDKYRPRLSLDYVAPPEVSIGTSNFGSLIGGGTMLSFSDLLGHHNLTTTFQTFFDSSSGGFINNFAAVAAYTNQKSRWNWGFAGGQIPYASGAFSQTFTSSPNGPVLIEESSQIWQRNREIAAIFSYPFSRARRVEFSTGYRHISFDGETRTQTFSLLTGGLVSDTKTDIPTPDSLRMGTASAALVYDTSIFGGVSPVLGQRYRLELGGSRGTLDYYTLLGDYRRYFRVARPLVLAGRILHVGRYGKDSSDSRMQDFFIGSSSLVRGYNPGSFSANECVAPPQAPNSCPVFDQLIGSRLAIANAEVRVPLLGALGVIPSRGVPPVEAAFFYDGGVAWTAADSANFLGGSRRPVTSLGGTLRVNVLGFTVAELNYVHPNDRPAKGWLWEFNLSAGF